MNKNESIFFPYIMAQRHHTTNITFLPFDGLLCLMPFSLSLTKCTPEVFTLWSRSLVLHVLSFLILLFSLLLIWCSFLCCVLWCSLFMVIYWIWYHYNLGFRCSWCGNIFYSFCLSISIFYPLILFYCLFVVEFLIFFLIMFFIS